MKAAELRYLSLPSLTYETIKKRRRKLNKAKYKSEIDFEKMLDKNGLNTDLDLCFAKNWPLLNLYFGDFVDIERKIVIEIDGQWHKKKKQKEYDQRRDRALEAHGYKVLRLDTKYQIGWLHLLADWLKFDLPLKRKKPKKKKGIKRKGKGGTVLVLQEKRHRKGKKIKPPPFVPRIVLRKNAKNV